MHAAWRYSHPKVGNEGWPTKGGAAANTPVGLGRSLWGREVPLVFPSSLIKALFQAWKVSCDIIPEDTKPWVSLKFSKPWYSQSPILGEEKVEREKAEMPFWPVPWKQGRTFMTFNENNMSLSSSIPAISTEEAQVYPETSIFQYFHSFSNPFSWAE